MTNQEVYNYIKMNVDAHETIDHQEYVADCYVKNGYGQVTGGYIANYRKWTKKEDNREKAEPSQKWHLISSYYETKKEKGFDMNTPASLGRIMCPQLMLWIAEVAGLKREVLEKACRKAIQAEREYGKNSRTIKNYALKDALHWLDVVLAIKEANNWDEVIQRVQAPE